MFNQLEPNLALPDRVERRRILENASYVLIRAQSLLDELETRPELVLEDFLKKHGGETFSG